MSARVRSVLSYGTQGLIVDIECSLSNNLPNIVIVGFASKAVDEAKERVRSAFASCRLQIPRKRITINLAPADIPKDGSSFDLPIAAAIMLAGGQATLKLSDSDCLIGELGLDGCVRPVRGIIGKLLSGRESGLKTYYIPRQNLEQAMLVPGVKLIPLDNLRQLYEHLSSPAKMPVIETGAGQLPKSTASSFTHSLSDIVGQAQAKRALEIAAAGGHNLLFNGPPGTGKSMLAKALPSILPDLTLEEVLEVTQLHSLASKDYERIIIRRPFRSPHHSASHVAITGGGISLRPGEISLAHHGVLFLDEVPEFGRQTIEALRQPLEDRIISVARAKDTVEFPAGFILIATANPCPCGYYGSDKPCECSPHQIQQYQHKLSGPILDRIDLFAEVQEVLHAKLLHAESNPADDRAAKLRVLKARQRQNARLGGQKLNAAMTNQDIKLTAALQPGAKELLDAAAGKLGLSARAYMRTVKVSRTIADLGESAQIESAHVSEALQYRSRVHAAF